MNGGPVSFCVVEKTPRELYDELVNNLRTALVLPRPVNFQAYRLDDARETPEIHPFSVTVMIVERDPQPLDHRVGWLVHCKDEHGQEITIRFPGSVIDEPGSYTVFQVLLMADERALA